MQNHRPIFENGSVLTRFGAGLFWLGWAGYNTQTHWIVPTLAGLFIGFGIYTIFLQVRTLFICDCGW